MEEILQEALWEKFQELRQKVWTQRKGPLFAGLAPSADRPTCHRAAECLAAWTHPGSKLDAATRKESGTLLMRVLEPAKPEAVSPANDTA